MAVLVPSRPSTSFADYAHAHLLTTWHDFLTLYPWLLFIPDHSRLFWTVQNNREQSGTPRPSSPTSQDLPRPIPVLSRLPYDFTRPLPTIKVGKGRLSGRLSVTGALGRSFSEILGEIHPFSFKKMHLKMSSAKGRLFSLGLNELTRWVLVMCYLVKMNVWYIFDISVIKCMGTDIYS